MSKYFGLLLLSSMLQFSPSFAEGGTALQPEDGKIYVTRKALRFVKNEIIVVEKKSAFVAQAVHSDEKGLYVNANELTQASADRVKKIRGHHHWKNKRDGKKGCGKKMDKKKAWKAEKKNLEQKPQAVDA